jgi:hypothetical protein
MTVMVMDGDVDALIVDGAGAGRSRAKLAFEGHDVIIILQNDTGMTNHVR